MLRSKITRPVATAALGLLTTAPTLANDFVAPEMTANQPGLNATANTAVYAGKGLIGAVTYGNYNIKGVDANGQDVPTNFSLQVLLGTLHYNTDRATWGYIQSWYNTGRRWIVSKRF